MITQLHLIRVHNSGHLAVRLFDKTDLTTGHQLHVVHLDENALVELALDTDQHKVVLLYHHDLALHEVQIFADANLLVNLLMFKVLCGVSVKLNLTVPRVLVFTDEELGHSL
jgi:hypothetical protein